MKFKPAVWVPIAAVLAVINVVAVGFAASEAEPWHAGLHAALAVAFAHWAQRMRQGPRTLPAGDERMLELEGEVSQLGRELGDAQERLDFAERMLAQSRDQVRVDRQD